MMEEQLGGITQDICYDKKMRQLNLELATDKIGIPIIIFQDWSGKTSKELFRLHIKEAIELKAVIDQLVFDWGDRE